jgi:hypothetical protein
MAEPYHDPNLKRRTLQFLNQLGLASSVEEHEQQATYTEPVPLREPPVQITAVTRQRPSLRIGISVPGEIDVALVGMMILAAALILLILFWLTSTFPVAGKFLGLAATFGVIGAGFVYLGYGLYRRA